MEQVPILPPETVEEMIRNRAVRIAITTQNLLRFFQFYFPGYITYPTAWFQYEIMQILEDDSVPNFFFVAFRGSAKTTIATTIYPIWAIPGKPQKKFILILCQTRNQAKQMMMNIKGQFESNDLLKNDLGPFQEESDEWGSTSIVFKNHNARITVASTEQSIRGLRHNQHRPGVIICDDVENIASTMTRDSRQKTYDWLTGEVIPSGDRNTRLIVVGNLLHEDSLLMRLKQKIADGEMSGIFKSIPLLGEDGTIMWPGKYPTLEDIEQERKKLGNDIAWKREYLLQIVPTDDQVIQRDWIMYHDLSLPPDLKDSDDEVIAIRIAIDPAISERDTADYTAIVIGWVIGDSKNQRTYIDPYIINKRVSFPVTLELCKELFFKRFRQNNKLKFIVEDVAYQKSLPQMLESYGLPVTAIRTGTQDKRSRLNLASYKIKNGEILFPKKGAERLVDQLVNFGVEKHDDLADSCSLLAISLIQDPPCIPYCRVVVAY